MGTASATISCDISPNVFVPAFLRAQCGIPFALDIADIINARGLTVDLVGGEEYLPALTRLFSAKTKLGFESLTEAIAVRERCNVVELGAGLSPRGLILVEDPSVKYVSADLNESHEMHLDVLGRLISGRNKGTHWFLGTDPLSERNVVECATLFADRGPIGVICEGLLTKLTHEEKFRVAQNIRELLHITGGTWYTSDFHTTAEQAFVRYLAADFLPRFDGEGVLHSEKTAFDNLDEAIGFMGAAGFDVFSYPQREFVSYDELGLRIPDLRVEQMLDEQCIWAMVPK
jgi:hypothetical protein